jgi:hypothetical protein
MSASSSTGALGSGAPSRRRNGDYRHGRHTKEAIAERQFVRALRRFGFPGNE